MMEEQNPKRGMNILFLNGVIFTCMGIGYLIVGISALFWGTEEEMTIFRLVFGGLGLAFLIAGLICLFLEVRNRIRNNRLLRSGNYVMAEIGEVVWCTNIKINRRHPYMVMCRYRDMSGNVHLFKSRYLNFDPEPLFKDRMVRVYVENEDFRHYYVNIDEVLPKVTVH